MQPKTSSPTYLAQASKSVYEAMANADEKAVWLMQGWLFYSDPGFWQPAQVKAYLQGVSISSSLKTFNYHQLT